MGFSIGRAGLIGLPGAVEFIVDALAETMTKPSSAHKFQLKEAGLSFGPGNGSFQDVCEDNVLAQNRIVKRSRLAGDHADPILQSACNRFRKP